jgi:hypothetical protein
VTPLGTIKAKRGQVRIDGPLGTLWHLPVSGELSAQDRYELEAAAREYGQPVARMIQAGEVAAKAATRG